MFALTYTSLTLARINPGTSVKIFNTSIRVSQHYVSIDYRRRSVFYCHQKSNQTITMILPCTMPVNRFGNSAKNKNWANHILWDLRFKWVLTRWGRVTHVCVCNLIMTGSDNGLSPGRRQAIIWANAEMLLVEPWATNFSDILIEIHTITFGKFLWICQQQIDGHFVSGLNVLNGYPI